MMMIRVRKKMEVRELKVVVVAMSLLID